MARKAPNNKIKKMVVCVNALFPIIYSLKGDRGGTVVKVLCYKSEGSIPAGVIGIFH